MTALLVLIAANPYFQREHILGGLSELRALGTITSVLLIIAFFIAIAFYCRTLQTTLEMIRPENRTRKPTSV